MNSFLVRLATLFGIGRLPKSPGTWGTLATIPVVLVLSYSGPLIYMTAMLLFFPLSILSAQAFEKQCDSHDAKEIVVDEVIGFMITMTWMPQTWQAYVAGFVLFRFLDILKPPPIRYFDRSVPGGLGVVIDDVVAGVIANIILQIVYAKTNWLGSQYITFGVSN